MTTLKRIWQENAIQLCITAIATGLYVCGLNALYHSPDRTLFSLILYGLSSWAVYALIIGSMKGIGETLSDIEFEKDDQEVEELIAKIKGSVTSTANESQD